MLKHFMITNLQIASIKVPALMCWDPQILDGGNSTEAPRRWFIDASYPCDSQQQMTQFDQYWIRPTEISQLQSELEFVIYENLI